MNYEYMSFEDLGFQDGDFRCTRMSQVIHNLTASGSMSKIVFGQYSGLSSITQSVEVDVLTLAS